jgi:nitroimidazol reductase NimA-like FMN-containing flavoprotein (pyridoxamine 5'-phosphate oxidase superfamily)
MALSKEEREQFLAEPHVAALSVGAGDKRGPLTVPIWYQYNPAANRGFTPAPARASTGSSRRRASSR